MFLSRNNSRSNFTALLFIAFVGFQGCQMFWRPHSPEGYVLPQPKKMILDSKLAEISGLFYMPDEKAFLTISDDKKKIYRLTENGELSEYFDNDIQEEQLDYEDIVKHDGIVYALASNGMILSLEKKDSGLIVNRYPFPGGGKNDFESLYYDSSAKGLILICKRCASEKGAHVRTAWRFDLATKQFDGSPFFTISTKDVKQDLKDGEVEFNPSAAAIHPIEKRLYVLSSSGHLLVICNTRGKVENVYRLNPTFYPQSEGIAFASNGDLYITNEAKLGKPTLLKIEYKHTGNIK